MATILLNGVETDASSITGSELADKLTVSGGVDGLSVDLAEGDDRVEMYADSENIANAEVRVSSGDDVISVVANDGAQKRLWRNQGLSRGRSGPKGRANGCTTQGITNCHGTSARRA